MKNYSIVLIKIPFYGRLGESGRFFCRFPSSGLPQHPCIQNSNSEKLTRRRDALGPLCGHKHSLFFNCLVDIIRRGAYCIRRIIMSNKIDLIFLQEIVVFFKDFNALFFLIFYIVFRSIFPKISSSTKNEHKKSVNLRGTTNLYSNIIK